MGRKKNVPSTENEELKISKEKSGVETDQEAPTENHKEEGSLEVTEKKKEPEADQEAPAENQEEEGSLEATVKEKEPEADQEAPTVCHEAEGCLKVTDKNSEIPVKNLKTDKISEMLKEDPQTSLENKETEKNLEFPKKTTYKIVCRNAINETFGGVSFSNGVAYTKNSFTASWFRNKEGYIVEKE